MTKPWTIPSDMWAGETVAVLASGSSMTQELADSVKHLRRIAVRRAFRFAPDADMLLALDGPPNHGFWEESADFAGMRLCGCECDVDALYVGLPHEPVTLKEGHTIHVRNNGLSAIRLAARMGAKKIILLGFDPPPYSHFYDGVDPDFDKYPGLEQGLVQIAAELRNAGIEVIGAPAPKVAPPDYLLPGELDALIALIGAEKPKVVLEIGCNAGKTAAAILAAFPKIKRYIGIDVEPGHVTTLPAQRGEPISNPGELAKADPRFEIIVKPRGSFDITSADLPVCDVVFIDGDHSRSGVLNDFKLACSVLKPGGLVIFHDDNGRDDMEVSQTLAEIGGAMVHIDGTWLTHMRV